MSAEKPPHQKPTPLPAPVTRESADDVESNAADRLQRLLRGYLSTQAIFVAAKLGIADALASGPRRAEALAELVGADAQVLRRLLRGLVNLEVLCENEDGSFALSPLGQVLGSDHPGSLAEWAVFTGEVLYPARAGLLDAVRTGQSPFPRLFGRPFFEHLADHPALAGFFGAGMTLDVRRTAAAVARAYDFSRATRIVDVGGGHGTLIATILAAHPHLSGVLFDRAESLPRARETLTAFGVADRCTLVEGDFFTQVPAGGDVYLLSWILHDWTDEESIRILTRCASAMAQSERSEPRLLVLELLLPERVTQPSEVVDADLAMLVLTGGKERTASEYRALLAAAGLTLRQVIEPGTPRRILEATLAPRRG